MMRRGRASLLVAFVPLLLLLMIQRAGGESLQHADLLSIIAVDGAYSTVLEKAANEFSARHGVAVELELLRSNNDVVRTMRSERGRSRSDLCLLDEDFWDVGITDELIEPLSSDGAAWLKDVLANPDDVAGYGPPVCAGCLGIAYDKLRLTDPISWRVLWDPAQASPVGLWPPRSNEAAMVVLAASLSEGGSQYENRVGLGQVCTLLGSGRARIGCSAELAMGLVNREICAAPMWSWTAVGLAREYDYIGFAVPLEGAFVTYVRPNIVAGCDSPELAAAFVDFLLSPDVQGDLANIALLCPMTTSVLCSEVASDLWRVRSDMIQRWLCADWDWAAPFSDVWARQMESHLANQ